MNNNTPADYPGKHYQPLFDLLQNEHGIIATETEMADIIHAVNKCQSGQLPAEVQERIKTNAALRCDRNEGKEDNSFRNGYYSGYVSGATAYATKLLQCDIANKALEEKIRGLEEQVKAQKPQGAVWVKASEYDNSKGGVLFYRFLGPTLKSCGIGSFSGGTFHGLIGDHFSKDEWEYLYILDESGATDWKARYDTLKARLDRFVEKSTDLASTAEWGVNELSERYTAMKERAEKMEADLCEAAGSIEFLDKENNRLRKHVVEIEKLTREALALKGEEQPVTIEFCYQHPDGRVEVKYRRIAGTHECAVMISEVNDLIEKAKPEASPYFYRKEGEKEGGSSCQELNKECHNPDICQLHGRCVGTRKEGENG